MHDLIRWFFCGVKNASFFVWNFKGTLWNSTQNILPIHWKMCILSTSENLRALRFKSSQAFLKQQQYTGSNCSLWGMKMAAPPNLTGLKLENYYFFTFLLFLDLKLENYYFFTFLLFLDLKLENYSVFTFLLFLDLKLENYSIFRWRSARLQWLQWIANSLELLQYCTTPSKYGIIFQLQVEKK